MLVTVHLTNYIFLGHSKGCHYIDTVSHSKVLFISAFSLSDLHKSSIASIVTLKLISFYNTGLIFVGRFER